MMRKAHLMTAITWTNPSVLGLLQDDSGLDPLVEIERRARELALTAIEDGWSGPPYDPFELADLLDIELVARQDLGDARLVSSEGRPRIEFNPSRRPARVRFSIAHEIGHWLFPDYAQRVRYRDPSERRGDDWQLEVLCNVAAAEVLMPAGAFPIAESDDLSLPHLLDQRARFGVSTEALLRRAIKLTDRPSSLFAAARLRDGAGFRIDYLVNSRVWAPSVRPGGHLPEGSVLHRCTAVGFADDAVESWAAEEVHVQAVGVPAYPGDRFPRVVGLITPVKGAERRERGLRYVRGDASEPRATGPTIIATIVNDQARSWGGSGFTAALTNRFPTARESYTEWASSGHLQRGAVHLADAGDGLWIASLVAQSGYGASSMARPRLRLAALRRSLETLARLAAERKAEIHMPPIGTGQAGGHWPSVRDLILEELADRHVPTVVYVLPDEPMPEDAPADEQLSLL
jgi:Zn-dependent peptidase ImmA (M78 family)/O-acetyl-ADP-ribose deacetylase (regulator of RNase III)